MFTIVVPKETRHGEKRVAAVPETVATFVACGYKVKVEAGAGVGIGFSDRSYRTAGAEIIKVVNDNKADELKPLYENADLIIRIKRADRNREIVENDVIPAGAIMAGFLDPLDNSTPHVQEWKDHNITTFSLDLLPVAADDSMNVLAPMSKIAGHRSVIHALDELGTGEKRKAVIIGTGTAGIAAINEAKYQGFEEIIAVARSKKSKAIAMESGATSFEIIHGDEMLMRSQVSNLVESADIIISSACRKGTKAPILIDEQTLDKMKRGSVIIDLAKTEGGNVIGSVSDDTVVKGNGVRLALKTGYPKEEPEAASQIMANGLVLFSKFIEEKGVDLSNPIVRNALITTEGQKNPTLFEK